MDFSEPYKYTGPAPSYSPNGLFVACVQDQRVIVRDVDTLQMVRIISCLDKVVRLDWAHHSRYLLCSLTNRAQVFSLDDHEWSCKIDEGSAGVRNCIWAPDGCTILVIADFQIRISIYSLQKDAVKVMRGPKFADRAIAFSPKGKLLAYAERTDCKEYVSLVSCDTWELRSRIATTTQDLADLMWSPSGKCFVVWDILLTYKLLIYNAAGNCLASYSAYQDALGIRCVSWSPDGSFLAVGSYDQELRILNSRNWRPSASMEHSPSIREDARLVTYSEVSEASEDQAGSLLSRSRYIVCETPLRIQSIRTPPEKANPKIGVAHALWSSDGQYLASRDESMPNTVFIWSAEQMELSSILIQANPVRSCRWEPHRNQLVVGTGNNRLYLWSPDGASCVHVPVMAFNVHSAQWSPRGDALLLTDKDTFCCAYIGVPTGSPQINPS